MRFPFPQWFKKKKLHSCIICLFPLPGLLLLGLWAVAVYSSVPTCPTEKRVCHAERWNRWRPLHGLPTMRGLQPPHRRPTHHDHVPPWPEGNQACPEALGDSAECPIRLHRHRLWELPAWDPAALQREGTRRVWAWRESSWKGIKGSAKVLPPLPPHASCSPATRLLLEHPVL